MKVYAAIGHFKDSKNMTSVAITNRTKKDFMQDLRGNEFVQYVVITEKMLDKLLALDDYWDLYEAVKKMTSNYRVWNDVVDYIGQCGDILTEKVNAAKAE